MTQSSIALYIVGIPLVGAFVLPILGRLYRRSRNVAAFLFVLTPLVLVFQALMSLPATGALTYSITLPFGFNMVFHADGLALFMAVTSGLISGIIILYSFGYISHYENQNEYYMMVVLFFGAMMGLIASANLIFLYIFWEITALASWRLIGFFRKKNDVLRADKAFLITVFGALVMLIGFISLYQQTGSFDLSVIAAHVKNYGISHITVFCILIGILSKSATFPLHTWLPDAGVAPSPVTALLHAAVLVKIGVYVFMRLFLATFQIPLPWPLIICWIAAVSALVSAGAALFETDFKRIVAYSTVSQIAFIFLGLASGSPMGIYGGLLYILMHGLAKAGLFLCAGIVEQNTHTKDIRQMGGLMQTMPFTAVAFLLCAFSVMGIPPFGGFFSKYMVFAGSLATGNYALTFVFLIGACLTILYLMRLFTMVFMGAAHGTLAREGSFSMVFCVVLLAALSLVAGIFVNYPLGLIQKIVSASLLVQA